MEVTTATRRVPTATVFPFIAPHGSSSRFPSQTRPAATDGPGLGIYFQLTSKFRRNFEKKREEI